MKRFLCANLPKENQPSLLSEDEMKHAFKVLRLTKGDSVIAIDGSGSAVIAKLESGSSGVQLMFVEEMTSKEKPRFQITLEASIIKQKSMELLIEKSVELGVTELVPIVSSRVVVQTGQKGGAFFQNRWQKIADQALKQCERLDQMKVAKPRSLSELLSETPLKNRLWLNENRDFIQSKPKALLVHHLLKDNEMSGDMHILVGPEGGFTPKETEQLQEHAQPVHLGPIILRAETAAIASVALISQHLRAKFPS